MRGTWIKLLVPDFDPGPPPWSLQAVRGVKLLRGKRGRWVSQDTVTEGSWRMLPALLQAAGGDRPAAAPVRPDDRVHALLLSRPPAKRGRQGPAALRGDRDLFRPRQHAAEHGHV